MSSHYNITKVMLKDWTEQKVHATMKPFTYLFAVVLYL